MREPAVVRTPAVQMMSFTPTGTPASTPTSWPARTCRSISAAAARASASLTVRNAPTCGSAAAMRSRAARTSSTDDTSRWRTRRAASRTPRSCRALMMDTGGLLDGLWDDLFDDLFDDLGHADQPAVARGGVRQQRLVGGGIQHLVGPQAGAEVLHVGGWRHGAGVQGAEPFERLEDVIEIGREPLLLRRLEAEARERRDPPHLVARDRHESGTYRTGTGLATRTTVGRIAT